MLNENKSLKTRILLGIVGSLGADFYTPQRDYLALEQTKRYDSYTERQESEESPRSSMYPKLWPRLKITTRLSQEGIG